jgi:serine-type D-Ala-D-Ala carboxypeptidase/endopeptidase (penicillin-binding protein 4)
MLPFIKQALTLFTLATFCCVWTLVGITPKEQAWVRRSINNLINQYGLSGRVGISITSLRDQTPWYVHAASETFIPASNQKLCTTAAALSILGPDYRFPTQLLIDGHKKRSTLIGNIYVKGSGDPSLTHTDLQTLIRKLRQQKIRVIRGNIVLDIAHFELISFHPNWFAAYRNKGWCPHVSALLVDRQSSPRFISAVIRRALKRCGITITGKLVIRQTPDTATVVATHMSEPLNEIIKPLLKHSDNLYAECLFKALGAERFGAPGTWQKGSKAVLELFNDKMGIDAANMHIVDGSGISHKNLIAPDHLTTLLSWCRQQPFFQNFLDALPTAGRDGTLKYRMAQPGIATHVKAKTGTLSNVSSLSGYIIAKDKTPLIFSIMSNHISHNERHKRLEDKICTLLAQFSSQQPLPDVTEDQQESQSPLLAAIAGANNEISSGDSEDCDEIVDETHKQTLEQEATEEESETISDSEESEQEA